MRPLLLSTVLLLSTSHLVAQVADSAVPTQVTMGRVTVTCTFGAANVKGLPIAATLGKDLRQAPRRVEDALTQAGFTLIPGVAGTFETRPLAQWPDTVAADAYRDYPHPGVVARLVIGMGKRNTVVVFGGVDALCASAPGAPDSTVLIGLELARARLQAALGPFPKD